MAIRPPVAPRWATSTYGNDEAAWEEAKEQCRRVLHRWCADGKPHDYADLIAQVTAIPWLPGGHSSGQLGHLLGQVSLEELDPVEDRPVISSIVFPRGKSGPSHGYWAFIEDDLGIRVPRARREVFWDAEMKRCFDTYGHKADPA